MSMENLSAPQTIKSPRLAAWSEQRTCPQCGTTFIATSKKRSQRFCKPACASSHPYRRATASRNMRKNLLDPGSLLRQSVLARMKTQNPSQRDDVRQKISLRLKGRPLHIERGGNGREMPKPQSLLLMRLGPSWAAEYALGVPLDLREENNWPRCCLLDLANLEHKLAVECDGLSHNAHKARERDSRKAAILNSLGWQLLRFTNLEILTNTSKVLDEIAVCLALSPAENVVSSTTLK